MDFKKSFFFFLLKNSSDFFQSILIITISKKILFCIRYNCTPGFCVKKYSNNSAH